VPAFDAVKDVMLADYNYRAESLIASEKGGETRLNLFIGVLTATIAVLGLAIKDNVLPRDATPYYAIAAASFGLFLIGVMTLLRLMIRDERTDECKRDLDGIRDSVKDYFVGDVVFQYFCPVGTAKSPGARRKIGGLSHLMATMNAVLCATWLGSVVFLVGARPLLVGAVAFLGFIMALGIQFWQIENGHVKSAETMRSGSITHAGGVVFRKVAGEVEYLIVKSKDAKNWVLPKGKRHNMPSGKKVDGGYESSVTAARRETLEEAGVVVEPRRFLDILEFEMDAPTGKRVKIRAKFYLMEWLFDAPSGEGQVKRPFEWVSAETALNVLPTESQLLLKLAEQTLQKGAC
jgi:8-oxo-dGTP pyrophosphatase MutT (NUDIX family)